MLNGFKKKKREREKKEDEENNRKIWGNEMKIDMQRRGLC
jgi:hypothetical protein